MSKQYKNLIRKISFVAWFSFAATTTFADTTAADELAQSLNNIHTMQAAFEQYLINDKGARVGGKTKGKMMLERPGKFRWEISEPNKQLIIINKDKSYTYDADLEQLVKRKVNYRDPRNPAMLLSSPTETLKQSFKITKLKKSEPGVWFELTPKNQENGYRWIKMHFVDERLHTIQIADNLGQKSVISFSKMIFNTPISAKMFTFTPPKNTDIFESE